jgi:predicted nucleic acid-binding protein
LIVLDASAAVELLLRSPAGDEVAAALAAGPVVTPVHFDAEVYGTLRRLYLRRLLLREHLQTAIDQLERFDAQRVEIVSLLPNVFGLVDVLGAHDVFYVLLAMTRSCPLLTCDLSLGRAAAALGVKVIAVDRSRPA